LARGSRRQECIRTKRCAGVRAAQHRRHTGGRVQQSARAACLPARGAQVGRSRAAYWTAHLYRIHFRQRARKIRRRHGQNDAAVLRHVTCEIHFVCTIRTRNDICNVIINNST